MKLGVGAIRVTSFHCPRRASKWTDAYDLIFGSSKLAIRIVNDKRRGTLSVLSGNVKEESKKKVNVVERIYILKRIQKGENERACVTFR